MSASAGHGLVAREPAELAVLHARRREHFVHRVEKGVVAAVDDFANPRVDDEFRARQARGNRDVDRPALNAVPVVGGLADRILLGVGAEALVEMRPALRLPRAARTPAVEAVLHPARRSVVARGKDVVILHDDRPDMATAAVRALRHDLRDFHEVFVPSRTRIFSIRRHLRILYHIMTERGLQIVLNGLQHPISRAHENRRSCPRESPLDGTCGVARLMHWGPDAPRCGGGSPSDEILMPIKNNSDGHQKNF